jgi:5'-3' exonuclease
MKYYFLGCSSWNWFFNHYYPPFLSDIYILLKNYFYINDKNEITENEKFKNFELELKKFELSKPFTPFLQLLSGN